MTRGLAFIRRYVLALFIAAALWGGACFPGSSGCSGYSEDLRSNFYAQTENNAHRHAAYDELRAINPEWDLMFRAYSVLAYENFAFTTFCYGEVCAGADYVDRWIDETLATDAQDDGRHWLLPYGHAPFKHEVERSTFVESQIALMLGARELTAQQTFRAHHIAPNLRYREELARRVERFLRALEASGGLCVESYPNECWSYCMTHMMLAVKMHDALSGENHSALIAQWIELWKRSVFDARTGLPASSFTPDGRVLQGPEGSSVWPVVTAMSRLDFALSRTLHQRARTAFVSPFFGVTYAREWPNGQVGADDIDVGPTLPGIGAAAASSGLAFVAAHAMNDAELMDGLQESMDRFSFARAFKLRHVQKRTNRRRGTSNNVGRRFVVGNALGEAVALYAFSWDAL